MWYRGIIVVIISCVSLCANAAGWQTLSHGLEYAVFTPSDNSWGKIHVFRCNPAHCHLEVALADANSRQTAKQFAQTHHALVATNGGFFTPESKPLGLRIQDGKLHTPLRNISWWGIFYVTAKQIAITTPKSYNELRKAQFAVQCGPRLIVDGRIPKLKPGADPRTALGIDRRGNIILLATESHAMTTQALAEFMQNPATLDCRDALNLDGGTSTQLYAAVDKLTVDAAGFNTVTDAVIIKPGGINGSSSTSVIFG